MVVHELDCALAQGSVGRQSVGSFIPCVVTNVGFANIMQLRVAVSCFVLLGLTVSTVSLSKEIYKIVGPDGKISFSDRPPADAAVTEKVDVIRTPTEVIAPAPAPPSSSTNRSAKQAMQPSNAAAAPSTGIDNRSALDTATEKAIVGVLGYNDLIKQTESLCIDALPTSMRRYSQAAQSWQSRNAKFVSQAQNALASVDAAQRGQINATIRSYNANSLAVVLKAPTASKIKWCDTSLDSIQAGSMDVNGKPNFTAPLSRF